MFHAKIEIANVKVKRRRMKKGRIERGRWWGAMAPTNRVVDCPDTKLSHLNSTLDLRNQYELQNYLF